MAGLAQTLGLWEARSLTEELLNVQLLDRLCEPQVPMEPWRKHHNEAIMRPVISDRVRGQLREDGD
jgi:hypothetical protein